MFKVGDKVRLNSLGISRDFIYIKEGVEYLVTFCDQITVCLKGIEPTYYPSNIFDLVEEKEMKKIKFDINPSIKEAKETFPCVREGKTTGRLYYFMNSCSNGYPLHDDGSATSFENTKPWAGTVAITQD